MIVSHKHKLIFVKTRKTAGSTLEKLLLPYLDHKRDVCTGSPRDGTPQLNTTIDNGHMAWGNIQSHFQREWEEYTKITIERNPWDKVVSSYFWHKLIKEERFGKMSFEDYVLTCDLLPRDWSAYADRDNKVRVDKIYKYEDMGAMYEDLNLIFGFNINQDLIANTKLKSGIRKVHDYKELHTPVTIDRVTALFVNEINHLGYRYE